MPPVIFTLATAPKLVSPETVNDPALSAPAVPMLPMLALPLTDKVDNVPRLVIFDCDEFTTSPA